jgi:hypothetical protein
LFGVDVDEDVLEFWGEKNFLTLEGPVLSFWQLHV